MARQRQQYTRISNAQSRYQYKNWTFDSEGNRTGAYNVRPLRPEHADLISTAYYNPAKKTSTVYSITFDLDAHRGSDQWKDEEGRLDWGKIGNYLFTTYPKLAEYMVAAIRSTGGKGLALMLAISPLEICDSTKTAQQVARAVQTKLYNLLHYHQMGVDQGALGLIRDFPNWRNPAKVVDGDMSKFGIIQSERNRPAVLSELITYLNSVPACSGYKHKKTDLESYLYPDERAETKLAVLYKHLHELYFDEDMKEVVMTTNELKLLTGLSHIFLAKILKSGLTWLKVENLGKREGWSLRLVLTRDYTNRAFEVLCGISDNSSIQTPKITLEEELKRPEEVKDGERNEWITKLSLMLKHSGVDIELATMLLKGHVARIEGYRSSRNCRNSEKILINIYENKPEYFGCKMGQFDFSNVVNINRSNQSETKFKKGTSSPQVSSAEILSFESEVARLNENHEFKKSMACTFEKRAISPAETGSVGR